jgi:hypothetical protein
MNWCERKGMGKKVTTFLSNDNVFQTLTCQNPVTCPNEAAGISQSAVSEAEKGLDAALSLTRSGAYTGSSNGNTVTRFDPSHVRSDRELAG